MSKTLPKREEILDQEIVTSDWKLFYGDIADFIRRMIGGQESISVQVLDGIIQPDRSLVVVDTENQSPYDEITNIRINNVNDSQWLMLFSEDTNRTVVIKNAQVGDGGVYSADNNDIVLSPNHPIFLSKIGNSWRQIDTGGYLRATDEEFQEGSSGFKVPTIAQLKPFISNVSATQIGVAIWAAMQPAGTLLANKDSEYAATTFPDVWTMLTDGSLPTKTYAEYEAEISSTGKCDSYAVDDVNLRWKTPHLSEVKVGSLSYPAYIGTFNSPGVNSLIELQGILDEAIKVYNDIINAKSDFDTTFDESMSSLTSSKDEAISQINSTKDSSLSAIQTSSSSAVSDVEDARDIAIANIDTKLDEVIAEGSNQKTAVAQVGSQQISAINTQGQAIINEASSQADRAKSYAESINPEILKNKTVFSINEASKDASGNPNFMSVSGNQITFNGAVKYTQANGESKEYASVSPIALASGYVMLNNGIASVVPALEVQQSEPDGIVNQPTFTSNTTDGFTIISNLIKEDLYRLYNGVSSTYVIGPWSECVLGIEYISDLRLMSYTLQADTKGSVEHPIEWVVEGSIDGSNWFQIDYRNDEDFASGEEKTYYVNISEKYSKHRVRFVRGVEAGGNGELKKIGFEFLTPANQTVWFNSYNNQAKQYNGTDWVDYNGVPVGTIIDGVAYTYQYNTQKNVEPWINTATKDSLNELNRFRLIDSYRQDVFWYKIFEETQNDGSVKYWCRQGGLTYVASNKNITQTLLIPFTEREPTLLGQSTEARIDSQSINMYFNPYWLSIQIYNSGTNQSIYWYTEGYCAKPEEIL